MMMMIINILMIYHLDRDDDDEVSAECDDGNVDDAPEDGNDNDDDGIDDDEWLWHQFVIAPHSVGAPTVLASSTTPILQNVIPIIMMVVMMMQVMMMVMMMTFHDSFHQKNHQNCPRHKFKQLQNINNI